MARSILIGSSYHQLSSPKNAITQEETQTARLKAAKVRDVSVMRSDGKANDATWASGKAMGRNVEEGAHLGT